MTLDPARSQPPARNTLNPTTGAAMGVGVGAALTAATGDGFWIGAFAAFGAVTALATTAACRRRSQ